MYVCVCECVCVCGGGGGGGGRGRYIGIIFTYFCMKTFVVVLIRSIPLRRL